MSVRSMTGFARTSRAVEQLDLTVSVKTVNHRGGLDLHFQMSQDLDRFENGLRTAVKRAVARGHVDVRILLSRADGPPESSVDVQKLDYFVSLFRAMAERYQLGQEPDLNAALRLPEVLKTNAERELPEGFESSLLETLEETLEELNRFRSREGKELAALVQERNASVRHCALEIEKLSGQTVTAFQSRLRQRLSELLGSASIDPQRLAQEAALLADKSDIAEEVARLRIHSRELDELLTIEAEAGKKLDFLCQEMQRETNTILSKTSGLAGSGLAITRLALTVKSEIEKIREQAMNLE